MIKKILQTIGLLYDPALGDQVPPVQHEAKPQPAKKPKAQQVDQPAWHASDSGRFYQKQEQTPGADFCYEIRATSPKGQTGRSATLTAMDREIILAKVKSINWETAARVKQAWSQHDGQPDSEVVKALGGEMSERTVRGYTRCFNLALSQSGEGEMDGGMQKAANAA